MPERYPPDDPREWLNRARSSLAQAKVEHPDVYFEDLVFTRYPGVGPPVSRQEYEEALKVAEEVVRWAEERLRDRELKTKDVSTR
jgi:HEPN domain-containing protein